ncbi:aromatic-ring-hydroxylating dioxygenase subunit beta [Celeribacter baekdonensis]|uniref:Ortho-halobenzoate 1,2-dioxygenase beta-ISP protein OhbA n=1 Tax=Celeribacter baekdonensis B30 TaxID=1208323 RepID=K2JAI1_9RHOB|nr:aromatic-ring-hydroxylating dioxygenase subunit beta [Celeribacter baekdonensis]EKE67549.1 ortho-halobenzoate 1,2-dioxygenase beta-ISP protein OhbA [Celeribacter baekdonensis B30]
MSSMKKRAELTNLIGMAQAQYAYTIDDGDFYDWPNFFADDCFYQITSADNFAQGLQAGLMWLDSKAMLHDRILSLLEANVYERHSYRHILGQPNISSIDGDEVESETSFMVARITREGPTDLFATGRYVDRYKVSENGAKIMKRIVVLDSSYIDTLLGFPL